MSLRSELDHVGGAVHERVDVDGAELVAVQTNVEPDRGILGSGLKQSFDNYKYFVKAS